jgi:spermidine/putrescine transport system permease protein
LPFIALCLVLGFFYLPIGFLVMNSFNAARFSSRWGGFSTRWYERLTERADILAALGNSVRVALAASVAAMILGTAAALVLPDILMGMSLLLLFVSLGVSLNLVTVTVAHVTFCLSYVALVVQARLQDFDFTMVEAARDLGATRFQAFRKITLPLLAPGILAGGLLAFTLSIDDYVVTYFVKGPGADTLPTLVYSMIKTSKDLPVINALSTIMLVATFLVVAAAQRLIRPVR